MTIGVLLAQLGTPDAPTAKALRPYLRQFLSDRRVIDYHPLLWRLLLHGIILRSRPRRSAKMYRRIWSAEGSPLLIHSRKQVSALQSSLGDDFRVILGMTYGNPSVASAVAALEGEGIERIVVLPMFPQFSSTTTSCIYDAVYRAAAGNHGVFAHDHKRFTPALRFVAPYFDHPAYIEAMRAHILAELNCLTTAPDQFVISFHGIPERYVRTGDPYRAQCERTADLLAAAMGWRDNEWFLSFQSRFGPEEWLQPYTEDVLAELPARGVKRPFVFSPGFTTDCLETLDELGNEGGEQFEEGGGDLDNYYLAPCLNANPEFIAALAQIVRANAGGWQGSDRGAPPAILQESIPFAV